MHLLIDRPTKADIASIYRLFETSITDAFGKEGVGFQKEDINAEILHKQHLLEDFFYQSNPNILFLVAKQEDTVIGTISFGICGEDIKSNTKEKIHNIGELGSLYILPCYQGQGVGSALIKTMLSHLFQRGIRQFCLDSGYKRAQQKWIKKFGAPYKIVKDYWGPGIDDMIWICNVADFIK